MKVKDLIELLRDEVADNEVAVFIVDSGEEFEIVDVYDDDDTTNIDIAAV